VHLVSFDKDGSSALGLLPDGVDSTQVLDLRLPGDATEFLVGGAAARAAVSAATAHALRRPIGEVRLLPPVTRPGKIIGIGLNYRDHAVETGQPIPEYPTVFAKFSTSVAGPNDPIRYPEATARLDYEGELGVVIGRRCRDVSEADALDAVGGYVVVNDVSARDVQNRTSQWTLGKSFDGFAPIGPALVTADEIPDPQNLDIAVRVNGEQRQQSNTAQMIFTVAHLVAELSRICTLEPGDVIATGTPAGVGIGFTPERLLAIGDEVVVTIEGLGELRNVIVGAAG
jgi:2-keto-4-pentenoate hydratase/2-oxohepta-3-ene-1,7-dioic acid hydratase in catechol pathway